MPTKIAICTGGGDAPGLNAVIRAAVRSAVKNRSWEVYGIEDGFEGLIYPSRTARHRSTIRRLDLDDVRGILHKGGTILGTTNRGNPFRYPVTRGSKVVLKDVSDRLIRNFKKYKLNALIAIGGDGTLAIAEQLFEKGLPVVGVPKTIDNDLSGTDVTFGFNTAVEIVTDALDKLHTTAESHHRVIVVEVMGRHTGWIALEAGIAGGADIIIIPEIPFDFSAICNHLRERKESGSMFSIVVVAEGALPVGGKETFLDTSAEESGGAARLGGIAYRVAARLEEYTGLESRVVVLGHLQRGGSPTTFDRFLATRFGVEAIELIAKKQFGYMTCLRGRYIRSVRLSTAIGRLNRVKTNGPLVRVAEALGISMGR